MGRAGRVNGANIARSPSNVSFSNDEEKLEFLRERGYFITRRNVYNCYRNILCEFYENKNFHSEFVQLNLETWKIDRSIRFVQIPIYDVSSEIITNYFYDNKEVSEEEVLENPSQNILRNRCFPATRREKKKKKQSRAKGEKTWRLEKTTEGNTSWLFLAKIKFHKWRCG